MEGDMPTLQVRDIPEDIYKRLTQVAKQENRSITQQTIVLLQEGLGIKHSNKERRRVLMETIKAKNLIIENNKVDPVELIREDRDR
jgi:hypothetical protein